MVKKEVFFHSGLTVRERCLTGQKNYCFDGEKGIFAVVLR